LLASFPAAGHLPCLSDVKVRAYEERRPIWDILPKFNPRKDLVVGYDREGHAYLVGRVRVDGGAFSDETGVSRELTVDPGVVIWLRNIPQKSLENLHEVIGFPMRVLRGPCCINSVYNLLWSGAGVRAHQARFIPSEIFWRSTRDGFELYDGKWVQSQVIVSSAGDLERLTDKIKRKEKAALLKVAKTISRKDATNLPRFDEVLVWFTVEGHRFLVEDLRNLRQSDSSRFAYFRDLLQPFGAVIPPEIAPDLF